MRCWPSVLLALSSPVAKWIVDPKATARASCESATSFASASSRSLTSSRFSRAVASSSFLSPPGNASPSGARGPGSRSGIRSTSSCRIVIELLWRVGCEAIQSAIDASRRTTISARRAVAAVRAVSQPSISPCTSGRSDADPRAFARSRFAASRRRAASVLTRSYSPRLRVVSARSISGVAAEIELFALRSKAPTSRRVASGSGARSTRWDTSKDPVRPRERPSKVTAALRPGAHWDRHDRQTAEVGRSCLRASTGRGCGCARFSDFEYPRRSAPPKAPSVHPARVRWQPPRCSQLVPRPWNPGYLGPVPGQWHRLRRGRSRRPAPASSPPRPPLHPGREPDAGRLVHTARVWWRHDESEHSAKARVPIADPADEEPRHVRARTPINARDRAGGHRRNRRARCTARSAVA